MTPASRLSSRSVSFHTTRWTQVRCAKADSDDGRKALADLCDAYYEPVVAFLRCELRALPLLEKALEYLPESISRKVRITFILSGKLTTREYPDGCPGAANDATRTIGMNVEAFHARHDLYQYATHEVFHLLEGLVYSPDLEKEWAALNDPTFQYAGYVHPSSLHERAGFVSPYSQTKGQEDRADLFMWMLLYPEKWPHRPELTGYSTRKSR